MLPLRKTDKISVLLYLADFGPRQQTQLVVDILSLCQREQGMEMVWAEGGIVESG